MEHTLAKTRHHEARMPHFITFKNIQKYEHLLLSETVSYEDMNHYLVLDVQDSFKNIQFII